MLSAPPTYYCHGALGLEHPAACSWDQGEGYAAGDEGQAIGDADRG